MQTYQADIECSEPVGLGFSCGEVDSISFSYAGEHITESKITKAINEFGGKCWKCFSRRWRLTGLTPVVYQNKAAATRR